MYPIMAGVITYLANQSETETISEAVVVGIILWAGSALPLTLVQYSYDLYRHKIVLLINLAYQLICFIIICIFIVAMHGSWGYLYHFPKSVPGPTDHNHSIDLVSMGAILGVVFTVAGTLWYGPSLFDEELAITQDIGEEKRKQMQKERASKQVCSNVTVFISIKLYDHVNIKIFSVRQRYCTQ